MSTANFQPAVSPTPIGHSASDALQLLVGPSAGAAHLWAQIRRVAPHFRTALLTGERGTGAEAVARALHDLSPATWRPFLTLSSQDSEQYLSQKSFAAPPPEGTLFLSDIESLSRSAQSSLLRLLRHRGPQSVRVVAFARHGLRPAVSTGIFSSELASSLAALRIALPALRERAEDIPLLVSHVLQRRAQALGKTAPPLTAEFLSAASHFSWPGNLEQMTSVLEALIRRSQGDPLTGSDLESAVEQTEESTARTVNEPRMVKLETVIQEHIRSVLFGCNGNKLRAAEILGISRSTLYRMLDAAQAAGNGDFKLPLAG
ncbi:two-component system, NtrC family, response regulator HydG [Bryocella elongata]|uniref:Two-component system, NtrC family, response regulator HydG n=1 Tax=Bryocella elongata TaxID=863522 RepID=A0A1H5ZQ41_9BACT|nr:sigma 54-interacting transcriptional regulator [Bryocella elongata]SEG38124.1 two-component system, NtrC family, response regulator HydG [Bryocella elongata]